MKGTPPGCGCLVPGGNKDVSRAVTRSTTPGRSKKEPCTPVCQRAGMQTVRPSGTSRLCHPFRVRALFAPESGGVATHRLPAGFHPGTGWWLLGFPEGTKRVAGRWRSRATPVQPEKSDAPREGVPEGCIGHFPADRVRLWGQISTSQPIAIRRCPSAPARLTPGFGEIAPPPTGTTPKDFPRRGCLKSSVPRSSGSGTADQGCGIPIQRPPDQPC